MKIAFDVDVLAKQMSINDYVHKVAEWGYKYIEQSPPPADQPVLQTSFVFQGM
jgi:myo-inositol catabolism protein IolH